MSGNGHIEAGQRVNSKQPARENLRVSIFLRTILSNDVCCITGGKMEYSSWYAAILFFTVNFLTTDADMRICRGDQMVHAIIRVCTGARYMLAKDVVLQSPTITTEDGIHMPVS